jgi:hypothetical protein
MRRLREARINFWVDELTARIRSCPASTPIW